MIIIKYLTVSASLAQTEATIDYAVSGEEVPAYFKVNSKLFKLTLAKGSIVAPVDTIPFTLKAYDIGKSGRLIERSATQWINSEHSSIDIAQGKITLSHPLPVQWLADSIYGASPKQMVKWYKKYPLIFPMLYEIDQVKYRIKLKRLEQLLAFIPKKQLSSVFAKRIQAYLRYKKATMDTKYPIPELMVTDQSLVDVSLSKISSKKKLVAYVASGCPYSLKSLRVLDEMHQNISGLDIVTVWGDDTMSSSKYSAQNKKDIVSWTDQWDQYEQVKHYFKAYRTPIFWLLDETGKVLETVKSKNAHNLPSIVAPYITL